MGVQIGAKRDSGFDDPIGMLKDCHRRVEHFLHILCVVVERAGGRTLSGEEAAAVQASIQYFRVGGKRHNADEEESLFPRLRKESGYSGLEEIQGLEEDHQAADRLHAAAETLYQKWIAAGALDEDEYRQLESGTRSLRYLYEEHIRIEEQVVFPRAAQLLGQDAVRTMGDEFRLRRA
jgi:hemerythrin-like domain-containing protein